MIREPSETSADGERIATSDTELYEIAKRLTFSPESVTQDEVIVMAAYLVSHFESDP